MPEAEHGDEHFEQVGRYLLLGRFGDRDTSVPVVAYDIHLDRRVLLYRIGTDDRGHLERMLERARRWSRVVHPHLVAVHDSFEVEPFCYVTVEHVQGQPLPEWLTTTQRGWPEVQQAMRGAALSLEALHAAGLVHGRVSPESIVVDGAGHGRLAGFAPDVAGDGPTDRAADVRAFASLVTAKNVRAPRWLADVVAQASDESVSPAVALTEIIGALDRNPARTKKRIAVAAVLALAIGGVVLGQVELRRRLDLACAGADQLAAQVWNDERRKGVETAFSAVNAPFAAHAASRVVAALDARSDKWATVHTRACEATRHDKTQSEEALDRRMQCLDERREELDALAHVFESADRDTVLRASDMVESLTPIAACETDAISTALAAAPPAIREPVDVLRSRLARVGALNLAGKYAEGLEEAEAVAEAAAALDYQPLSAEATLMHGRLLVGSGEPLQAVPMLEKAVRRAWIAGHHAVALRAWTSLERLLGETLQREDDSDEVWGHGLAAWERAGKANEGHADLLAARAVVMFARGKYRESAALHRQAIDLRKKIFPEDHTDVVSGERTRAREELEKTLEIREAALGPDHPHVASVLENLGVVAYHLGELDESMERLQEALAIKRAKLGPDSPSLGGPLLNIGNVLHARGDYAGAREHYERAREIFVRGLGPDHPNVGIALNNIGWTLRAQGEPHEAVSYLEQALALREKALGPEHPSVGSTLGQLGQAQIEAGNPAQGRRTLERATALWEQKPPARGDDDVASARMALARILVVVPEGRERALALARLALEGYREASLPHEAEAAAVARFVRRHGG
jgi:tetratricopeptide (TPR) repeat protein/tRNA A-37 threonylcarbamoyl transferase component Bud32